MASLEELERWLDWEITSLPRAVRIEMLRTFELDGAMRARRIGELYARPHTRALAEILIDMETNQTAQALVLGMLLEKTIADEGRQT